MAKLAGSFSSGTSLPDAAGVATAGSGAPAIIDVRGSAAAQSTWRKAVRRAHLQSEAEEPLPSPAASTANYRLRRRGGHIQGADVLHLHRNARRHAGAFF